MCAGVLGSAVQHEGIPTLSRQMKMRGAQLCRNRRLSHRDMRWVPGSMAQGITSVIEGNEFLLKNIMRAALDLTSGIHCNISAGRQNVLKHTQDMRRALD